MSEYSVDESWKELFTKYNIKLSNDEKIFPEKQNVLQVFRLPLNEIRVVLLGQDPYHNKGQAHGLSFSVPKKVKIP
jgi:uracil-DNA glycosylase